MTSNKTIYKFPLLAIMLLLVLYCPAKAFSQKVIYVDQSASGDNDGTSWQNAFVSLQKGLDESKKGDQIWVASGVYTPDIGPGRTKGDRSARFEMKVGSNLYGGFKGGESNIHDRIIGENPTILSGDLLANDIVGVAPIPTSALYDDNSFNVLRISAETEAVKATVDRISVRGAAPNFSSGLSAIGPFCTLSDVSVVENIGRTAATIIKCKVSGLVVARNRVSGQGTLQVSATTITDSLFEDNISSDGGAIMVFPLDSVFVIRSVFYNNRASDGGAILSSGTHLVVVSSFFLGNAANCSGGAINMDERGSLTSVNNVFIKNESLSNCNGIVDGGAITVYNSRIADFNSTFAFNSAAGNGDVIALLESEGSVYNGIWNSNNSASADISLDVSTIDIGYLLHDEALGSAVNLVGPIIQGTAEFASPGGLDQIIGTQDDDFRLTSTSLGVKSGNVLLLPPDIADLDGDGNRSEPTPHDAIGTSRLSYDQGNSSVNLGAYEQPIATSNEFEYRLHLKSCFELFPNPFQTELTINFRDKNMASFEVVDMLGRVIVAENILFPAPYVKISTEKWSPGVYAIRLIGEGGCTSFATRN